MNGEDLNSSSENLGCTYGELKEHMESQFKDGMTWENYGLEGWHIDHIMPLSKGGSNHYTNLQPLWATDNISKGAKWGPVEKDQEDYYPRVFQANDHFYNEGGQNFKIKRPLLLALKI